MLAALLVAALVAALDAPPTRADTAPAVPHVIVLVFSGLPQSSLLGADGEIDAARYPGFAALAASATWARRASAVAARSVDALPAIVTGRLPGPTPALPIQAEHQHGLFTLLEPSHAFSVVEHESVLYAPGRSDAQQREAVRRLRSDRAAARNVPTDVHKLMNAVTMLRGRSARPRAYFVHLPIPGLPFRYTGEGRSYANNQAFTLIRERWPEEPWWAEEAWQRHLEQVRYADRIVAELLEGLRSSQRFDDTIVVVTADQGISFWPGEQWASADESAHPEDILGVPLFVKRAGQSAPERIDARIQTIDVLPTIAALVGVEPTWPVDGCSIFDARCPRTAERAMMAADGVRPRRLLYFGDDVLARPDTLRRQLALFGAGADPDALRRFGRWPALRDASVGELRADVPAAGRVKIVGRGRAAARNAGPRVLASLTLDAEPAAGETPWIAVAVGDRIETVVPAPADPRPGRKGRLISAWLRAGRGAAVDAPISFHLVVDRDGAARPALVPLDLPH